MDKAQSILEGLGGKENIEELVSCITRLRVEVADIDKVDEAALHAAGAFGVQRYGNSVQVVIGPTAEMVEDDIKALM